MTADQFTQLLSHVDAITSAVIGMLMALIVAITWRG